MSGARPRFLLVLTLALASGALGCRSAPIKALRVKDPQESRERLQQRLDHLVDRFAYHVDRLLQGAIEASDRPEDRRELLMWKALLINHAWSVRLKPNPTEALVDLWVTMVQLDQLPDSGATLSGASSKATRKSLREEARAIAASVLPKERFDEVEQAVSAFARKHPLSLQSGPKRMQAELEPDMSSLAWISDLSNLPGRVFFDESAQALDKAAETIDRLTKVAWNLPVQTSWQAQLLVADLESQPTTQRLVKSVEAASSGIAELGSAAKTLPASLRRSVAEANGELKPTLETVRGTVGDVRATVAAISTVVHDARSTSGRLTLAGEAWGNAVKEVRGLVSDARADDPNQPQPTDPEPPGRPFDIREYTATATELTRAGKSLQGAIAEARGLVHSTEEVKTVVDHAAERASGLIRQGAWALAALALLIFSLACVYRWACTRWLAPGPSGVGATLEGA